VDQHAFRDLLQHRAPPACGFFGCRPAACCGTRAGHIRASTESPLIDPDPSHCRRAPGGGLRAGGRGTRGGRRTPVQRPDRQPAAHLRAHGREPRVVPAAHIWRHRPVGPRRAGIARHSPTWPGCRPRARRFVGRSRERDLVIGLLADTRLVTLLGPGGIGKTRWRRRWPRRWAVVPAGRRVRRPGAGARRFVERLLYGRTHHLPRRVGPHRRPLQTCLHRAIDPGTMTGGRRAEVKVSVRRGFSSHFLRRISALDQEPRRRE
jgi:hypothetical protein